MHVATVVSRWLAGRVVEWVMDTYTVFFFFFLLSQHINCLCYFVRVIIQIFVCTYTFVHPKPIHKRNMNYKCYWYQIASILFSELQTNKQKGKKKRYWFGFFLCTSFVYLIITFYVSLQLFLYIYLNATTSTHFVYLCRKLKVIIYRFGV